jgi:hypothetical protein
MSGRRENSFSFCIHEKRAKDKLQNCMSLSAILHSHVGDIALLAFRQ